jgi:DNA/RNA endonuclease YhcR with UshA esterase domain
MSIQKKEPIKEKKPGFCPACGAYVGAFYSCPWCRSRMPHGRRLRVLQFTTIIAVIIGLVGLRIYASIDPAPLVNIGDIGPTYSNGTVTIRGNVTNIDYRVASDESWKTLIFTVTDNTGSIDVKAYTEATDELIENRNTPAIGDQCELRGSIYIRGDELYLLIETSSHYKYQRLPTLITNATELFNLYNATPSAYLGIRVNVTGEVTQVGSSFFELDNVTRIYFPDYVRAFAPDVTITVFEGDTVEVIGFTELYYDTLEVLPGSMYDITIKILGGGL